MTTIIITTAAGETVTIETVSAVTVNVDGVTVTFTPAAEEPAAEEPAVEEPAVEHWFSIWCRCEWCDAIRVALENCIYEQPWSCPRCESINNYTSPICEVCDTDISVAHRVN